MKMAMTWQSEIQYMHLNRELSELYHYPDFATKYNNS